MSERTAMANLYVRAQGQDTQAAAALADAMSDAVVLSNNRGTFNGREAAMGQIGSPLTAPLFREATWQAAREDGSAVTVSGRLPLEALQGGYDIRIEFDELGKVARIEQRTVPAPPLPPSELRLSPELKEAIANAWRAAPILVISVDESGEARPSLRGTVQACGDEALAFWARNAEGGTVSALSTNPKLTLFYREPALRNTLTFYGRGRVTKDEAERRRVYDNSPEPERAADPEVRGVAVIIELDRVEGAMGNRRVRMQRGAGATN